MRLLFLTAFISLLLSCEQTNKSNPAYSKIDPDLISQIDEVFGDIGNNDPGCAVAIVKDGEVVYASGYGLADLEHDIPISPETVFYIGSVSKQFVTMGILLLVEQGLIDLDDDIRKFIPEFPDYGYPLTLRHFIHHTSGVRDYLTLWSLSGRTYLDGVPKQAALDMICRQKELNFEPGTKYLYSNSCYLMLALVIERVTGGSMDEFYQEEVFGPLNMEQTLFFDDNTRLIKNKAFSYEPNGDGGWLNQILRFELVGSGGIYSNVIDLVNWDQNFYSNKLGKQNQALIETMVSSGKLNNGEDIGYAFALNVEDHKGLKSISHGGALAGYRAFFVQFPEERTSIIILSNFANANPKRRAQDIAEILLGDKMSDSQTIKSQNNQQQGEEMYKEVDLDLLRGEYYSEELDEKYRFYESEGNIYCQVGYSDPHLVENTGDRTSVGGYVTIQPVNESLNELLLQAGRVRNLKLVKQ